MFKRPPPKPTNLVDEFWEQLANIPDDVSDIMSAPATATCWMLHHPLDVALDYTKRWLPAIMDADDQLKAFVQFWLPTHTERRNELFNILVKQACWERTSWIPFTPKVRVLPDRYAHNAFMFSALVAADSVNKYRVVSGRYTNAELRAGSSFCKNNCKPPIVDGHWVMTEERVMRHFLLDSCEPMSSISFTVKLLRAMILTLMAPGGHTSFVIGLPRLAGGQLQFESLNIVKKNAAQHIEITSLNDRISDTLMQQRLGRIKRPADYVSGTGMRTDYQAGTVLPAGPQGADGIPDLDYGSTRGRPATPQRVRPTIQADTDINLTMAAIHLHAMAPEDRPAIHPLALDIERPAKFGTATCQDAVVRNEPEPVNTTPRYQAQESHCVRDDSPTYSNDSGSTTYSE